MNYEYKQDVVLEVEMKERIDEFSINMSPLRGFNNIKIFINFKDFLTADDN